MATLYVENIPNELRSEDGRESVAARLRGGFGSTRRVHPNGKGAEGPAGVSSEARAGAFPKAPCRRVVPSTEEMRRADRAP